MVLCTHTTHYDFQLIFPTYDLTNLIEETPLIRHMGRHWLGLWVESWKRQTKLLSIHISKYYISQINSHRFEEYTNQAYLEVVSQPKTDNIMTKLKRTKRMQMLRKVKHILLH
jgi:hypothetical protein